MSISCPACGHTFDPQSEASVPDSSVLEWFRGSPAWSGELAVDEAYTAYLRFTNAKPVSRERFVTDLAYLGVEHALDGESHVLIRD